MGAALPGDRPAGRLMHLQRESRDEAMIFAQLEGPRHTIRVSISKFRHLRLPRMDVGFLQSHLLGSRAFSPNLGVAPPRRAATEYQPGWWKDGETVACPANAAEESQIIRRNTEQRGRDRLRHSTKRR